MEFSAQAIATFLGGQVEGNPDIKVNTVAKIEEGKPGALSFLSNPKYEKYIYETQSSVVLVNSDLVLEQEVSCTLIRVPNAYESFAKLLDLVNQAKGAKTGIHKQAAIEESAKIGEDTYIGAFAYIGENVTIGKNTKIYPNSYIGDNAKVGGNCTIYAGVKIYDECVIGNNCIVHAGAVIGSDGFGFAPQPDGSYHKIPQIGNVVLEDFVEVGANTTIDRATMGSTIIRKGAKLDNLIQIAHNVDVGENTVIAAQTGIAGSTKIGKNCMFGGQVGIIGHISIADGVKLSAQTGISNSVKKPGEVLIGSPAMSAGQFHRSFVLFRNFPEIRKEIDGIKRRLDAISE